MKILILFWATLMSILLFSCDENSNGNEDTLSSPIIISLSDAEIQMKDGGNHSAMNLFSIIHELQDNDENIVFSPLSLNMALAMVWNGAGGETKQAIQKTMGMNDYSPKEVNEYFKKLRESFIKTDPTVQLAIANSIWYHQDFSVKDDFIRTNKTWYNAETNKIDFDSPQAPTIINQWCSEHTNGRIKEMVKTISSNTVMYLLNALYFKGAWADEFGFNQSATANAPFTKEDGSKVTVQMMKQNRTLDYYKDDYLALTSLPYGNQAYSMLFVLPNSGVSFDALVTQLKQEGYWEQCLRSISTYDVNLYIPRFKTEYEIKLNDALKESGMGIAFGKMADFSAISDIPVFISEAKQKSFIEVNEEGTEAAAVTSIEMMVTSAGPPPEPEKVTFRADRPFLFAIQENSTGTILFMGKIGKP
ncbi:MAG: serpin family protein [Dysgonamonadaceae bacterium]|jgi:serpin B|nr:serpin family protein [Dysgonamonadaceae bacterium]